MPNTHREIRASLGTPREASPELGRAAAVATASIALGARYVLPVWAIERWERRQQDRDSRN